MAHAIDNQEKCKEKKEMQELIPYNSFLREDVIFRDFSHEEIKLLLVPNLESILRDLNKLSKDHNNVCISILDKEDSSHADFLQEYKHKYHLQNGLCIFLSPKQEHMQQQEYIKDQEYALLRALIARLKPWRKGPFSLYFTQPNQEASPHTIQEKDYIFIDSEWQSTMKMRLILQAFQTLNYDLKDREVLDIGCNNGYYMFDLALRGVKSITGIDPIPIFFLQFYFIYKLSNLNNCFFRLLGVQDLHKLQKKYDLILCMGVLYHRKEPLQTLKIIKQSLKKGGILILETLILETDNELCLCPYPTYAKMANVFYIFSPKALYNLAMHAGFKKCELLSFSYTDNTEQRTTDFIQTKSLGDFLDKEKTFEGYPPACRGIFALQY